MERNWEEVYKKHFNGTWYPNEGAVRFCSRYLRRRVGIDRYDVKKVVGRVLDAGCGNGRHVVFFADQGYDVYGMDISGEAIEIATAWLNRSGLRANLRAGDIGKLPFNDDFFDVVVSDGVLDHMPFTGARTAFEEIKRVCAPGGYIYITLRSTEDSEYGRGKKAGDDAFELLGGYEEGILQAYYDLERITGLFAGLRVLDIELYEVRFPDKFGVDKSFLQSSGKVKKNIDLSALTGLGLKNCRWHIVAEKI